MCSWHVGHRLPGTIKPFPLLLIHVEYQASRLNHPRQLIPALSPWPAEPQSKRLWLSGSQKQWQFSQHSRHCRSFLCLLLAAGRRSERRHKCHSIFDGPSCGSMPICSIPPSSHLTPIYSSIHSLSQPSILPPHLRPSFPPPLPPFLVIYIHSPARQQQDWTRLQLPLFVIHAGL